jgi:hypothetical protein
MNKLTDGQKLLIIGIAWFLLNGGIGGGSAPPFKTDKLAVVVFEETADRTTQEDAAVGAVSQAVNALGGRFRRLDKDQVDLSLDEPWVRDAAKVKGTVYPWVVGATPRAGVNKTLPITSPAEAVKALQPLGVK